MQKQPFEPAIPGSASQVRTGRSGDGSLWYVLSGLSAAWFLTWAFLFAASSDALPGVLALLSFAACAGAFMRGYKDRGQLGVDRWHTTIGTFLAGLIALYAASWVLVGIIVVSVLAVAGVDLSD